MSEPYGLPEDLRRLISARTTNTTHVLEPLCVHHGLSVDPATTNTATPHNSYDSIMGVDHVFFPRGFTHFGHHHHHYSSSSGVNPNTTTTNVSDHAFCSIESAEKGWLGFDNSGNNRWPRQETLSLLEIRSRLDSKFRENNQKAPLWNEISRIMAEEFGYQRSGKKCKEKFENLYKYYKKTKEGKASRQDGKHYRFFRQLEAICGEANNTTHASTSDKTHRAVGNSASIQTPRFTINQDHNGDHSNNNNIKCSESLSISNNSSEFETSSSENNDEDLSAIAYMMKQSKEKQKGIDLQRQSGQRRVRKSWRAKVEEIVDSHMRKIIETQDAWMERMLSVVEQREQELASKEEERKRKESTRFDQQVHELWAKEKAWVEARDAALIEVVRKHIGIVLETLPLDETMEEEEPSNKNKSQGTIDANEGVDHTSSRWTEMEISNLIQLRTGFELRLRENGYLEHGLWDEIAAKLTCLGFDRSASECKQIWDEINISLRRTVECDSAKTRPWCLGLKLTDDDDL